MTASPDPSDVQVEAMAKVLHDLCCRAPWRPQAAPQHCRPYLLIAKAIVDGAVPGIAQVGDDEVVVPREWLTDTLHDANAWLSHQADEAARREAPPEAPKGDSE